MDLVETRHAVGRRKERGISQEAMDALLSFGTYRPNGRGGATTVAMTAAGRTKAHEELGLHYDRLMRLLDIVAVLVDGAIVTVYRRGRRLKFDGLPFRRLVDHRRRNGPDRPWGTPVSPALRSASS